MWKTRMPLRRSPGRHRLAARTPTLWVVVLEGAPFAEPFIYNFEVTDPGTDELTFTPATDYEVAVKSVKDGLESD